MDERERKRIMDRIFKLTGLTYVLTLLLVPLGHTLAIVNFAIGLVFSVIATIQVNRVMPK